MIGPKLTHNGPSSGIVTYWIGRLWLRLFGWDVKGQIPDDKKYVLIGAAHTSNWDFPFGIAALYVYRLKISWIGKKELFKWPYGWFMRWLGGIPVDRKSPKGIAMQLVQKLRSSEKLILVIAPSGTRKKMDFWKSGFYRIAFHAQVPIVCGYIDFEKKEALVGLKLMPTGNIKKDMDKIRGFFEGVKGKYPEMMTPVRLKDENTILQPKNGTESQKLNSPS